MSSILLSTVCIACLMAQPAKEFPPAEALLPLGKNFDARMVGYDSTIESVGRTPLARGTLWTRNLVSAEFVAVGVVWSEPSWNAGGSTTGYHLPGTVVAGSADRFIGVGTGFDTPQTDLSAPFRRSTNYVLAGNYGLREMANVVPERRYQDFSSGDIRLVAGLIRDGSACTPKLPAMLAAPGRAKTGSFCFDSQGRIASVQVLEHGDLPFKSVEYTYRDAQVQGYFELAQMKTTLFEHVLSVPMSAESSGSPEGAVYQARYHAGGREQVVDFAPGESTVSGPPPPHEIAVREAASGQFLRSATVDGLKPLSSLSMEEAVAALKDYTQPSTVVAEVDELVGSYFLKPVDVIPAEGRARLLQLRDVLDGEVDSTEEPVRRLRGLRNLVFVGLLLDEADSVLTSYVELRAVMKATARTFTVMNSTQDLVSLILRWKRPALAERVLALLEEDVATGVSTGELLLFAEVAPAWFVVRSFDHIDYDRVAEGDQFMLRAAHAVAWQQIRGSDHTPDSSLVFWGEVPVDFLENERDTIDLKARAHLVEALKAFGEIDAPTTMMMTLHERLVAFQ